MSSTSPSKRTTSRHRIISNRWIIELQCLKKKKKMPWTSLYVEKRWLGVWNAFYISIPFWFKSCYMQVRDHSLLFGKTLIDIWFDAGKWSGNPKVQFKAFSNNFLAAQITWEFHKKTSRRVWPKILHRLIQSIVNSRLSSPVHILCTVSLKDDRQLG